MEGDLELKAGEWTHSNCHSTAYSATLLPHNEYTTRIAVAQERKDGCPFPYLIIFNETVNCDHWWGGRERFGHGHQVLFELAYFDPRGSGEFLTAHELRWLPHYGAITPHEKEGFRLDDRLREMLTRLGPELFASLIRSGHEICLPHAQVEEQTGVPYEALFAQYQEPALLAEQTEAFIAKRKAREDEINRLFQGREDKPYQAKFSLTGSTCDQKDYLLEIIRMASGFDIYHAPEIAGEGSLEGMDLGIFGLTAFPGPIQFLEGMNKGEGSGPGTNGLRIHFGTGINMGFHPLFDSDSFFPHTEEHFFPKNNPPKEEDGDSH